MLDPKLSELADRAIRVRFKERQEHLQREIEIVQNKLTLKGQGRSGAVVQAVYDLCAHEVDRRAQIVWGELRMVLSDAGLHPSEEIAGDLK